MKKISLTFDDGPWQETTPHILEVLKKYNVPAAFMIWGEHAEKYPELLKEEAADPLFTIGNHTYHHVDLTKVSLEKGKNELKKTDQVIEAITGKRPVVIRPPYGSINKEVLSYMDRPAVIWSIDTKSWDHHDKDKVLENIKSAQDGDVVLMHDFQPADSAAIEPLIRYLQANDFKIVSLKDLIGVKKLSSTKVIYSKKRIIRS
ncbi:MAG: polysaccharide deacetylase family protein [Limosilactobacillus pontis]|uniref:polysaccharide deacetylase family protein n=1 Tax=Limosilactobacillus pontis TaxID=35787 RepID=UPI0039A32A81